MGGFEAGELTEAFEAERRGLFAHAYRMLGAHHEAEDVVQGTYVRVAVLTVAADGIVVITLFADSGRR